MTSFQLVEASSLLLLLLIGLGLSPGHAVLTSSRPSQTLHLTQDSDEYPPGELIIGLGTQSEDALRGLVKSWGGVVVGKLPETHAFLIRLDERAISASLAQSGTLAGFKYVERNYYVHSTFTPNDPLWPSQWAPSTIRADLAWDIELGERSVTVAVVDTGIDYHHEDLAENYLPSGYDWVNHDGDPMDDNGHGTHIAGIIGAITNNGVGVAGLAQVSVMAEKVLDSTGSGTIFDVAEGVIEAANKGARITNNSYGTYSYSLTLWAAFQYAWSHGVLNVAAAGNDNTDQPFYPAGFTGFVISVAGTDQNDARYTSSNYGDWIELSAPAVKIISTLPGGSYGTLTGTSMASAFVTGAAALLWSHFATISADQIRRRLQETAVDLGISGRDVFFGYGRVDLYSAVNVPPSVPVGGMVLEPDWLLSAVVGMEVLVTIMGLLSVVVMLRHRRHKSNAKN